MWISLLRCCGGGPAAPLGVTRGPLVSASFRALADGRPQTELVELKRCSQLFVPDF